MLLASYLKPLPFLIFFMTTLYPGLLLTSLATSSSLPSWFAIQSVLYLLFILPLPTLPAPPHLLFCLQLPTLSVMLSLAVAPSPFAYLHSKIMSVLPPKIAIHSLFSIFLPLPSLFLISCRFLLLFSLLSTLILYNPSCTTLQT